MNLFVYVEGSDPRRPRYDPSVLPNFTGAPEYYLPHVVGESVNNKRDRNRLAEHRPNVLAINFLLGHDYSLAESRRHDLGEAIPPVELGDSLDVVLAATCGVDSDLARSRPWIQAVGAHPCMAFLKRRGVIPSASRP